MKIILIKELLKNEKKYSCKKNQVLNKYFFIFLIYFFIKITFIIEFGILIMIVTFILDYNFY